ncbi:hypothetical protein A3H10_05060 [Candidatus Uhrbacteria bacterium RIFCSPLOWO2_12_FULL_46_10]|uniref:DUF2178 domain-containing protein n=1 Tax=Candidatus Uhrbacteria bacterium RIFCSPLOWO2_01_FULL_47_25 TaxID=1802402 RepID=A0A1F7UZ29_9BACT|nr:MAG: hypothetical protein UX68_C0032G0032 [Parcubacteria group bacterium GW2011_GWA2_46_9]OGL60700.1 MAG: hypothetical protein A2752_04400 [Candidatus Uhrbacteria bacterium RIFCSPHIGHO2_01_FULL_46_23]OGL70331.1 MAG: hypothetical protein A3D60_01915 [Candidatus Uhrbacteria bacterium RIFCSPHIGHO2_02_FULL_47_29]OGL83018.1 MAG: hypothetical protein A2936_03660 [Candidatus Uhrbacteria bacterium RIFCSPLOWO2_01_FULL_47_25]OGL84464.1 MAG: hypothetical protein A3I37_03650 [Candidatus Uhrbacteria bact
MNQFAEMIKQLLWLFLLVAFFVFYIAYYEALENLTKTAMIIMGLTAIIFSGWFSIYKYHKQTKQGAGIGENEAKTYLRWSPLAELQYDLLGWSVFIIIITLALISPSGITVISLAQAIVALITFFAGKRLFVERF